MTLLPFEDPIVLPHHPHCATIAVTCIPNTSPARGYLSVAGSSSLLHTADFCRATDQHEHWLPRQVPNDGGSASSCYSCPTRSLLPNKGKDVAPLAQCSTERYRLLQCLPPSLLPSSSAVAASSLGQPSTSAADVLLVASDNRGHGLFAMVERVANQILFARSIGLEPYVFIGEHVFAEGRTCEHGRVAYYDEASGPNVWEYFFKQPTAYRPGDLTIRGKRVRSVQYVDPEALYSTATYTQTYTGGNAYDAPRRQQLRTAANSLFGNGTLIRPEALRRADDLFVPWRAASRHILGLHVRGTDKVVAKKVPPEAYFPFVDAWIAAYPDALVFVATDERPYYERIVARYGLWGGDGSNSASVEEATAAGAVPPPRRRLDRLKLRGAGRGGGGGQGRIVSAGRGYRSFNVIADTSIHARTKGMDVLTDALLLSKCDYLLKTASAVAEFAMWVNLKLHTNHLDLQYEDRLHSQVLPKWAETVGRNDAQPYCQALAKGCRIDAQALLRGGQACAKCLPRVDASSEAAAKLALPMPKAAAEKGGRCEQAEGELRGLSQAECVAYARWRKLEFIGVQVERTEFGGCVVWNGRTVEYNADKSGVGCGLDGNGGACLCTVQSAG